MEQDSSFCICLGGFVAWFVFVGFGFVIFFKKVKTDAAINQSSATVEDPKQGTFFCVAA